MRILIITDLYPIVEDKTIPNAIKNFALALKDFGEEITVLRPNFLLVSLQRHRKIIKNGVYERDGIKIYNQNFILPFLKFDVSNIKEEFDLMISHMPSGHMVASLIHKAIDIPYVTILHQADYKVLNNFLFSFYFKDRLKRSLASATMIGARNKFLKETLGADFVLPSFVDKKNILETKKNFSSKIKIISLSQLIKRKNLDKVIEALSEVDFDFQYDIYGIGPEEKKLKKMIKKYNLENKISLCKYFDHKKIFNKLDEYDIFILPSVQETFGIAYIEAMSRGLITIGVIGTGIDGVIKNYENGFLINPSVKNIKDVLLKINLMNNDELEKISMSALETIKRYEKKEIITKYVDRIKKVLEK